MEDAETIIKTIRSPGPVDKRRVREFVYQEGELELKRQSARSPLWSAARKPMAAKTLIENILLRH